VREKILELIQTNPNLPPLPEILFGLRKLIDDPDCEVEDVYRLIKADPIM
jgi:HD-like signal output (HDOD) protein